MADAPNDKGNIKDWCVVSPPTTLASSILRELIVTAHGYTDFPAVALGNTPVATEEEEDSKPRTRTRLKWEARIECSIAADSMGEYR